jgi:hypothetical protein
VYVSWLLYGHIAGTFLLLGSHGVSMFVLYRIRRERDRQKILTLATLSGETIMPMYIALGLIVLTGILLGLKLQSFSHWWIWTAIGILVLVSALMGAIARPFFQKVKAACEVRPSGVPRISDEELGEIVGASTAHVIAGVGGVGLLAILYLMVFQPGVL